MVLYKTHGYLENMFFFFLLICIHISTYFRRTLYCFGDRNTTYLCDVEMGVLTLSLTTFYEDALRDMFGVIFPTIACSIKARKMFIEARGLHRLCMLTAHSECL